MEYKKYNVNFILIFADFETLENLDDNFYDQKGNRDQRQKYIGETKNGNPWGKGLMTYKNGELRFGEMLTFLFD